MSKGHVLEEFDWTGWSEWMNWDELEATNFRALPLTPGAYVIAAINRPINRAVGTDELGILDVGETGKGNATLRGRMRDFKKCARRRMRTGHSAGFYFSYWYFARHFPFSSLRVRWIGTETKEEAFRYEGRIQLRYAVRHCELPPLNSKFNSDGLNDFEDDVVAACIGGNATGDLRVEDCDT